MMDAPHKSITQDPQQFASLLIIPLQKAYYQLRIPFQNIWDKLSVVLYL